VAQNSFPKAAVMEEGLDDHQWKHLMLPAGRGVIDQGGTPYRLTNRDSVTNTVTIGVDSRHGENFALLDGFLHHMDAPEQVSVPPVTVDTVYEIGLAYDPQAHAEEKGPVTLTAWTAPADTSQDKSYLVLYRMTRKPNLALGATPVEEKRPRAVAWISVSQVQDLPTSGLVLVDTLAYVGWDQSFHRSRIDATGNITWEEISGGSDVESATSSATPHTIVKRGHDGSFLIGESEASTSPTTRAYVNARASWSGLPGKPSTFPPSSHKHAGDDITTRVPFEHVDGSSAAWSNSNLGSTWTSVAVNSQGFLGRYPSALKYKRNIRAWNPDPRKILALEPVQYDVRTDTAGTSESSDKGLIGFVADSYVETLRELVLMMDGEVEGFHYHLVGVAQQVVLRYLDKRVAALEAENELLRSNQAAIIAHLGLTTNADGRIVPDNGSEA
jgi:hypothetical protein